MEPRPPALGVQSLNPWTTKEVSRSCSDEGAAGKEDRISLGIKFRFLEFRSVKILPPHSKYDLVVEMKDSFKEHFGLIWCSMSKNATDSLPSPGFKNFIRVGGILQDEKNHNHRKNRYCVKSQCGPGTVPGALAPCH